MNERITSQILFSECASAKKRPEPSKIVMHSVMMASREALELAKQNVETYYSVVGITDDLLGGLALLEQISLKMFHKVNASALVWSPTKPVNRAHRKYDIPPKAMAIIEQRLTLP